MKLLNVAIWLIAIIVLSGAQEMVRVYFDFYAESTFVSFLLGGYIGLICLPLLKINFNSIANKN